VGKTIRAGGGVVWRPAADADQDGRVEVALVHRPRYDDWSLPKGKLIPGETVFDGAVREVLEETGHRVRLGRSLGEVRYQKRSDGLLREKVVRYWAMQAVGGGFTPSREVDELRWLPPEEARLLATRSSDQEVLDRFSAAPALTGSVLLVRHASAGERDEWRGDDRARPLDETGEQQAEELVRLLARFEVQKLVSANYLRCTQTLQPLGDARGLEIEEQQLLSEQGFPGREDEAVELIRAMGASGEAVAACSQRQVIPELVVRLAAEDGVELPEPSRAKKGSVWALSFDATRLCGAEYFPPPKLSEE
jgi:8-oxo-dGTP pyrophosphatase MutT (NUDIX family)/phosphohistidine phosphatase SixA